MLDKLFPLGFAPYLAGGLLLGVSIALLYLLTGRLGGMSTVFTSTWSYVIRKPFFRQDRFVSSRGWRLLYALGLIIGAFIWWRSHGRPITIGLPAWKLVLAGVLMGFGARMANGCTAGHGICGLGSLKKASLLAVLVFMTTAILTANLLPVLTQLLKGKV